MRVKAFVYVKATLVTSYEIEADTPEEIEAEVDRLSEKDVSEGNIEKFDMTADAEVDSWEIEGIPF